MEYDEGCKAWKKKIDALNEECAYRRRIVDLYRQQILPRLKQIAKEAWDAWQECKGTNYPYRG
jgi:hypothetical protein